MAHAGGGDRGRRRSEHAAERDEPEDEDDDDHRERQGRQRRDRVRGVVEELADRGAPVELTSVAPAGLTGRLSDSVAVLDHARIIARGTSRSEEPKRVAAGGPTLRWTMGQPEWLSCPATPVTDRSEGRLAMRTRALTLVTLAALVVPTVAAGPALAAPPAQAAFES